MERSFTKEVVHHPTRFDRFMNGLRDSVIHALQAV
jgi:hypothetical protein